MATTMTRAADAVLGFLRQPEDPMMPVVALFGLALALAVARTHNDLVAFYKWFRTSGFEMAKYRGYGQSACKLWGLFPAPSLSVLAMRLSGLAFLALVIAPMLPWTPAAWRAPLLGAAIVPYHLYFSQVYCEAHVGAHVTVLVPPALLLLSLSPALDATSDSAAADGTARAATAAFTSWLMKIVITSAYCGAGVCKLWKSMRSLRKGGDAWWSGSTLQAFIFEAMLLSNERTHTSFGVPTPFSYAVQKLHVLNPVMMLMPASIGALAFETLAPLMLLAPPHLASVPFALSGLAFHYGIALMQNIDFFSWWGPAYAFLLADPAVWAAAGVDCPADSVSPLSLAGSAQAALEAAPIRASLAIAYVALHVLAVVVLRFFPSVEILPFSSFPMFGDPKNLFDSSQRKWMWLSGKPHATGTLKNYAFPFCRQHTVQPHELYQLPFPYVLYGHGGGQPATLHANVQITNELTSALGKLTALGNQSQTTFATDVMAAPAILDALDSAKAAFAAAPRAEAPSGSTNADAHDALPQIDATASTADIFNAPAAAPAAADTADGAPAKRPVILFDGVCLLCAGFIHFVLDHDPEGLFDFASLQGETGTALLTKHGLPLDVSTMVLIEADGSVHTRSTAALRVLKRCTMPYCLAYAAIALPRPLRDLGYKLVARYRYVLFGKDDGSQCRRMTKAIRHRFL